MKTKVLFLSVLSKFCHHLPTLVLLFFSSVEGDIKQNVQAVILYTTVQKFEVGKKKRI